MLIISCAWQMWQHFCGTLENNFPSPTWRTIDSPWVATFADVKNWRVSSSILQSVGRAGSGKAVVTRASLRLTVKSSKLSKYESVVTKSGVVVLVVLVVVVVVVVVFNDLRNDCEEQSLISISPKPTVELAASSNTKWWLVALYGGSSTAWRVRLILRFFGLSASSVWIIKSLRYSRRQTHSPYCLATFIMILRFSMGSWMKQVLRYVVVWICCRVHMKAK